ncbi:MAG: hypothetical protein JOZ57_05630, partial [Abitibacteriaceae bacterium]|nr:hypothetical protein [Abditibacteriaceae bacterium]
MRVFITNDPYNQNHMGNEWNNHALWPCKWVACSDVGEPPFVTAYKRHFVLDKDAIIRVHVSADERYELFLDGQRIGRGSERGDAANWFFETYDLSLQKGEHIVVARVWSQGDKAPFAQMSVYPGFILSPQELEFVELIGTGVANWQVKKLDGYEFIPPVAAWGTGDNLIIHGDQFNWDFELGQGEGWQPVIPLEEGADPARHNDYPPMHLMKPGTLPLMLDEANPIGRVCLVSDISSTETHAIPIRSSDNIQAESDAWQQLTHEATALTIPPHTHRRILLDLEDYYCAYPEVVTSGGAGSLVRVNWQESLFNEADAKTKGNRDEVEGKYFITIWWLKDGIGDTFLPDGGQQRRFETLWWQCGRYVEVVVETADEPLTLESLKFRETRYPTEMESSFEANDGRLLDVIPLAVRVLQCCSHETYMDCPYYEQLMYIGDTRLQVLTNYTITHDDRLPRKALQMFDASRLNNGLTQSRYPSRVTQITRSFSLWWVAMVHDYALWRGDQEFIRERMLGVRNVLDGFRKLLNADGLVTFPHGPNFNFTDWVPGWKGGFPPDNDTGITALVNWQWVLVLRQAA